MKRLLVLVFILIAVCSPDLALAQDKLEFDFWQADYKLDDLIETKLDVREISGELDLDYDLAAKLSYKFWDQYDAHNSELEQLRLEVVKDFSPLAADKLAVGAAVDYYQQRIGKSGIDLFQLEKQGLNLVFDLEKNIIDRVNLFTNLNYGIYNDYQLVNQNLESTITYGSNYNYSLQTGLKFRVGPDLRAKLGYKLSQESLTVENEEEVIINDYDLTELSQLQHGLFLGLETRF